MSLCLPFRNVTGGGVIRTVHSVSMSALVIPNGMVYDFTLYENMETLSPYRLEFQPFPLFVASSLSRNAFATTLQIRSRSDFFQTEILTPSLDDARRGVHIFRDERG